MSLQLMVLTEKCIYLCVCWWETTIIWVFDNQEMCLNTRGLRDPGVYSTCPELQQQLWSHCRAVPQSSEVPGFVSSSHHTKTQLWGRDVPQEPSFIAGCSCQLAATKFLWFTTELCQFCKLVKAKQGRVGCETAGWKEKPLKTRFLYLIAAG